MFRAPRLTPLRLVYALDCTLVLRRVEDPLCIGTIGLLHASLDLLALLR